jgi:hypothetical protein
LTKIKPLFVVLKTGLNLSWLSCPKVFEKKNQKSAQSILLLQKKLEEYQKKVRELEEHGVNRSSQKIRFVKSHFWPKGSFSNLQGFAVIHCLH